MGNELDFMSAVTLERSLQLIRTGSSFMRDLITVNINCHTAGSGGTPMDHSAVARFAGIRISIEVIDHRDRAGLTVLRLGSRCRCIAADFNGDPDGLTECRTLRRAHLPVALIIAGSGRSSHIHRNINGLTRFHRTRNAGRTSVHAVTGSKIKIIIGVPCTGTVVIDPPGLAETGIRVKRLSVFNGHIGDITHRIHAGVT